MLRRGFTGVTGAGDRQPSNCLESFGRVERVVGMDTTTRYWTRPSRPLFRCAAALVGALAVLASMVVFAPRAEALSLSPYYADSLVVMSGPDASVLDYDLTTNSCWVFGWPTFDVTFITEFTIDYEPVVATSNPPAPGSYPVVLNETSPAAVSWTIPASDPQIPENYVVHARCVGDGNPGFTFNSVSLSFSDRARCEGRVVTADLNLGETPTEQDDVILGTPGNDVIYAGGGDDQVCAGAGNDRIVAGSGHDSVYGGDGNDIVWGGPGRDSLFGENGTDRMHGGAEADFLVGGPDRDVLLGEDGNDQILGEAGRDSLYGGDGDDNVDGGADTDFVRGNAGDDQLRAGISGNDRLVGDTGNDTLSATLTTGSTRMLGGSGNDLMYGSEQLDRMWGGAGNDIMHGNGWVDFIRAGDGNDTVIGGDGNDIIDGGPGNDALNGNAGNDYMVGMAGQDICNGGPGTDLAHGTCEIVYSAP